MSILTHPTPTIDSLLRVIEVRDSEVALLKLMVDKLKLQLLRRVRAAFGTSSQQLDAQINLIDITAALAQPVAGAPAKTAPANAPEIDCSLPAHLPREARSIGPKPLPPTTTPQASVAAARPAGAGCARSGRTSPSNSSTCPRTSR